MARTVRIKVLKFDELNDKAKEVARSWWRDGEDFSHLWNEAHKTIDEFASLFNVRIRDVENCRWEFTEQNMAEEHSLTGQRLATFIWNNYGYGLYKGKYYGKLVTTFKDGRPIPVSKAHPAGMRHVKRYSKCTRERNCVLTGHSYDEDMLDPIYKFLDKPDSSTINHLIRECIRGIYKAVQSEIEYQLTDEAVDDTIIANGYEFTADGKRF